MLISMANATFRTKAHPFILFCIVAAVKMKPQPLFLFDKLVNLIKIWTRVKNISKINVSVYMYVHLSCLCPVLSCPKEVNEQRILPKRFVRYTSRVTKIHSESYCCCYCGTGQGKAELRIYNYKTKS